jgi:hypothetical protein
MKGTTSSGFEFDVNPEIAKDYRVVDALVTIEDADNNEDSLDAARAARTLVNLLIDKKNRGRFYKHIENDSGIVETDAVFKEIGEILRILQDELKNS